MGITFHFFFFFILIVETKETIFDLPKVLSEIKIAVAQMICNIFLAGCFYFDNMKEKKTKKILNIYVRIAVIGARFDPKKKKSNEIKRKEKREKDEWNRITIITD